MSITNAYLKVIEISKIPDLTQLERAKQFCTAISNLNEQEMQALLEVTRSKLVVTHYEELLASVKYVLNLRKRMAAERRKMLVKEGLKSAWKGFTNK